jgi:hypothetical protein
MSKRITMRTIDLNIFYREEWDKETKTAYSSDNLFIDVYDYWQFRYSDGDGGSDHEELGILIECTPEQTTYIRNQFPEFEYGYDWFTFYDDTHLPTELRRQIDKRLREINIPVVR